ncbi:MAG: segregation and condensation protein A [Magnetovibrionaceae bacterium]
MAEEQDQKAAELAEAVEAFEGDGAEEGAMPRSLFHVDVGGFEGPIDLLLQLARDQKVDLTQISILSLADQYLEFIREARKSNLELAADYLVMAAWLAYLKSRLLLPDISDGEEPTGEELAAALQFQLQRLEAMQKSGGRLADRPRLGFERFSRGAPEGFRDETIEVVDLSLYELLKAYGRQFSRQQTGSLHIEAFDIYTVEDALQRLRKLVGHVPDWQALWSFLPEDLADQGLVTRSAIASTFAASLELAKEGKLSLRQLDTFGPIYLKSSDRASEEAKSLASPPRRAPDSANENDPTE